MLAHKGGSPVYWHIPMGWDVGVFWVTDLTISVYLILYIKAITVMFTNVYHNKHNATVNILLRDNDKHWEMYLMLHV